MRRNFQTVCELRDAAKLESEGISPHGHVKRIVCAQQQDGTFRLENAQVTLVPHEVEVRLGLGVEYHLIPPGQDSADVDVVFVSTTLLSSLPTFAKQAEVEGKYHKPPFRSAWPRDLVVQTTAQTRSTTTIEWSRPSRVSPINCDTVDSRWLFLKWPDLSLRPGEPHRSDHVFAQAVQVRIVQTSQRLAIGLRQPELGLTGGIGPPTDIHFWEELLQRVSHKDNITPANVHQNILEAVYYVILSDEHQVLNEIESGLCEIDSEMGSDHDIRGNIDHWRSVICRWRSYLHGRARFPAHLQLILPAEQGHATFERDPVEGIRKVPTIVLLHNSLWERARTVTAHCEATFAALMASMSMIESEKAITEAEGVTRLTQLAFFFIPITVASGIFGMNIREFDDPAPSVWMCVVTWIIAALGAYFALYGLFRTLVRLSIRWLVKQIKYVFYRWIWRRFDR